MRWLVLCAALTACKADDTSYPINIPTGGTAVGGGGGGVDAATRDAGDGDGGPAIAGKACLVTLDVRDLVTCASSGAGGFTVTLGSKTTTTADDGSFTIARPSGTNLVWQVSGGAIVTGAMSFNTSNVIPVIDANAYADLQGGNGVVPVPGEGDVIARVTRNGAAVTGATATASSLGVYTPFYDGNNATQWNQNATGVFGDVWLPGLEAGATTITVTPPAATDVVVPNVPIIDGAVTFVVIDVP